MDLSSCLLWIRVKAQFICLLEYFKSFVVVSEELQLSKFAAQEIHIEDVFESESLCFLVFGD